MQHFAIEIQRVGGHFVFLSLAAYAGADTTRLQSLFRLEGIARRLKSDVMMTVSVENSEEVVVRSSQQFSKSINDTTSF